MRFDYDNWQMVDLDVGRDKMMLSAPDGDFTWGQMYDRAMDLKQQFIEVGACQSHPVIMYGHKQSDMLACILACKLGDIPFVPIDSIQPHERMLSIGEQSGSACYYDCASGKIIPFDNPTPIHFDEKLAYIIFTSGSTGEPKGVCVAQKNLAVFAKWIIDDFRYDKDSVFMTQALYAFDISEISMIGTLHFGASMVHITREDTVADTIAKVQKYGISEWVSTPAFIKQFLIEDTFNDKYCTQLKSFWLCGEALALQTVEILHKSFAGCFVTNNYGPTECTVTITALEVTSDWLEKGIIPIGTVMPGADVWVDNPDENGHGELILASDAISQGYLNKPELTAERFFETERGGKKMRAMRSGDLGYIMDGVVYFISRLDDQVQLHGFRVELGAITNALRTIDGVRDAITLPLMRKGLVTRVVGFVAGDIDHTSADMKAMLGDKLVDYMIPSEIVSISALPLTVNGKVDKRKLLERYKNGELTS